MKKIAIALGMVVFGLSTLALADEGKIIQGKDGIQLDEGYDNMCREAIRLQDQRIRDLRTAVAYDQDVERRLLDGIVAREHDADKKEEHARKWREFAGRTQDGGKRDTLIKFASWLETEARTDRDFARERREALRVINRQWNQAQNAIAGHQQQLADLRAFCGNGGGG